MSKYSSKAVEFVDPIKRWAQRRSLDPSLLAAICEQESAWNPYAIRPEPGFLGRYKSKLAEMVTRTKSTRDDHWFRYRDLFSTSYGLMQVMYPVALELGFVFEYPTELCDPEMNIMIGSLIFEKKRDAANGSIERGLLYYNGGGNKEYPSQVLARMEKYQGLFENS